MYDYNTNPIISITIANANITPIAIPTMAPVERPSDVLLSALSIEVDLGLGGCELVLVTDGKEMLFVDGKRMILVEGCSMVVTTNGNTAQL